MTFSINVYNKEKKILKDWYYNATVLYNTKHKQSMN